MSDSTARARALTGTALSRRSLFAAGASVAGLGVLAACGAGVDTKAGEKGTVVVGASPVPHAKILEFVRDNLAEKEGLTIEVREYTDYILPNKDLASKDLDANFYMSIPYFDTEVKANSYKFTAGKPVHVEPLGLYSEKAKSTDDIPEGSEIAIPNDPTNRGRALSLLESAGLIKLKSGLAPNSATAEDVEENSKKLKFTELEAAMIARTLKDFGAGVVNGNYAIEAKLNPSEDSIFLEPAKDNPNANILAWRTEDDSNEDIKKLEKLLHSPEVKKFIEETYTDGSVLPAF